MSKIIGVTVGTPISPSRIEEEIKPIKTVNGVTPDENGNVEVVGNNGADGKDGATFTPSMSADGILSWTNDKGLDNPPSVNIKGADGKGGKDGQNGNDGKDGTSVTVSDVSESTEDGGNNVVTFSDGKSVTIKNGRKGSPGGNGQDGKTPYIKDGNWWIGETDTGVKAEGVDGADGKDGTSVTVSSVNESTASGGSNVVTFSDGKTLTIKNGADGKNGKDGADAKDGKDGERGFSILKITSAPSSYTTTIGDFTPAYRVALSTVLTQSKADKVLVGDTLAYSYYQYPIGYVDSSYVYVGTRVSIRGSTGAKGADGYTPQREVDYWTPADQEFIVQQVISALGTPVFGTIDENNNIILTGELADGTYTLKYEDASGTVADVGTIVKAPAIVNRIPLSINSDGSEYVGDNGEDGYRVGYRLNSSGVEKEQAEYRVTGFIPIKLYDVIRFKNVGYRPTVTTTADYIAVYDSTFKLIASVKSENIESHKYLIGEYTTDAETGYLTSISPTNTSQDYGYIRVSATVLDSNSIITINQEI